MQELLAALENKIRNKECADTNNGLLVHPLDPNLEPPTKEWVKIPAQNYVMESTEQYHNRVQAAMNGGSGKNISWHFGTDTRTEVDFLCSVLKLRKVQHSLVELTLSLCYDEYAAALVPMLVAGIVKCTKLQSLCVGFSHMNALDFISECLEQQCTFTMVSIGRIAGSGNVSRFFSNLNIYRITHLAFDASSLYQIENESKFYAALYEYLHCANSLTSLKLAVQSPDLVDPLFAALSTATSLQVLDLSSSILRLLNFEQNINFSVLPRSLMTLMLDTCELWFDDIVELFAHICRSNIIHLSLVANQDLNTLEFGEALRPCLQVLHSVNLGFCYLGADVCALLLPAMVREGNTVKELNLETCELGTDGFTALCSALTHENGRLERLFLAGTGLTREIARTKLIPALKHVNCRLIELDVEGREFTASPDFNEADLLQVKRAFYTRQRIQCVLALLTASSIRQGRLMTRSAIRRLPNEMFRLVGDVLV